MHQEIITVIIFLLKQYALITKKQTNKYSNFTINRCHGYKRKETSAVTYTCRYSSGYLIPTIQLCQDELGIKCPMEYLWVYVITMILIACKITIFSLYLLINCTESPSMDDIRNDITINKTGVLVWG